MIGLNPSPRKVSAMTNRKTRAARQHPTNTLVQPAPAPGEGCAGEEDRDGDGDGVAQTLSQEMYVQHPGGQRGEDTHHQQEAFQVALDAVEEEGSGEHYQEDQKVGPDREWHGAHYTVEREVSWIHGSIFGPSRVHRRGTG